MRVFAWDYRNRLTSVRDYTGYVDELDPGTLVREATYSYDVYNRRISKTVDADGAGAAAAVPTWFVYDGANVVMQFNYERSTGQTFLYGPAVDQVLANMRENGDIFWSLGDHLGSVRDIISNAGSPIDKITYSAFGEVIGSLPSTQFLFGYTGAVFDVETGLGYHRARYLDHATGRWLSEDPIGFDGDPSNLYRYVTNSPTNYTDPSGLKWVVNRDGGARATVTGECGDTVAELAKMINMDAKWYLRWLSSAGGIEGLPESEDDPLKVNESFTVPNTVFVGVGSMNWLANWATRSEPSQISGILSGKGFNVVYRDWRSTGAWTPHDVTGLSEDQYGFVYFGHGGKKKAFPVWRENQAGWLSPANDGNTYILTSDFTEGKFGVLIVKACDAGHGGWGNVASANALGAGAVSVSWGWTVAGVGTSDRLRAARNAK